MFLNAEHAQLVEESETVVVVVCFEGAMVDPQYSSLPP